MVDVECVEGGESEESKSVGSCFRSCEKYAEVGEAEEAKDDRGEGQGREE